MKKFIVLLSAISLTACTTAPEQKPIDAKTIIGVVAVIAIAGAVAGKTHASKCADNKAGFYRDNVTGNVYTC